MRMPATLGPANRATSTSGIIVSTCSLLPGIPPGPPTSNRMPPQEIANTRA